MAPDWRPPETQSYTVTNLYTHSQHPSWGDFDLFISLCLNVQSLWCLTFDREVLDATLKHDPAPFLERRSWAAEIACCGLAIGFIHQWKLLHFLQAKQHFGLLKRDCCDGTCANVYKRRRNNASVCILPCLFKTFYRNVLWERKKIF